MDILIIVLLIALNGVFAFAETAFISSDNHRLRELSVQDRNAALVLKLKREPDKFLSTIQVGITVIGIISGAVSGIVLAEDLSELLSRLPFVARFSYEAALAALVLLITYFSIVFGELIPKTVALKEPERFIVALIVPVRIFSSIMFPFVFLLSSSVRAFLKIFGVRTANEVETDLLRHMLGITKVALVENKMEKEQARIIRNTIGINRMKVSDIMVGKNDIKYLYADQSLADALLEAHVHQHTRYFVFDRTENRTVGYINFKDIINVLRFNREHPNLLSICRPVTCLHEQEYVLGALKKMTNRYQHIALVVDSGNNEVGLLTMEDILETIIGDINDEYDFVPDYMYRIADERYIAGGNVRMERINGELSCAIPETAMTLSRWMASRLGEKISVDARIRYDDVVFTVKKVVRSKIYEAIIDCTELPNGYVDAEYDAGEPSRGEPG